MTDPKEIARGIANGLRPRICSLLNHQAFGESDRSNCNAVEEEVAAALQDAYQQGMSHRELYFSKELAQADAESWHGVPCRQPSEHASLNFTDAPLSKLKDTIAACEGHEYGVELTTLQAKALLARLEAAEVVCEASRIHGGPCTDPNALPDQCNLCCAYKAWHRAKGEDGL